MFKLLKHAWSFVVICVHVHRIAARLGVGPHEPIYHHAEIDHTDRHTYKLLDDLCWPTKTSAQLSCRSFF